MADGMPKWGALALELAQRATRYGKEADNSNNSSAGQQAEEHTPVTFRELSLAPEHPKNAQWWWPQVPLLTALLKGNSKNSIATWVSLGRYRADKSSGGMKPDWTTFLCSALSNDEIKNSITEGLTALTTDLEKADRQFFSTTELVDALSEEAEKRPLAPLLLCFQKEAQLLNHISGKQPFIICRWEKLRSNGSSLSLTSQQHCPYCNSGSCTSGKCPLPQENSCQLDGTTWFNQLNVADKQGHCRRLNQFAAWLLSLQTVPQWDMMLTVPAWKPDQLPGVHVGAIVVYVRKGKWLSKLLAQEASSHKKLVEQIGIFSATFRAGATIAMKRELELYRKMSEQVEKQAQMLRLVESPLKRLSEALETMQEDTQTLRSILYDPHRTLFAVAPLVRDYFEEARWCSYGRVRWKGFHKPDRLTTKADQHAAGATIAAIICHLFGGMPRGDEDEKDLYGRVVALLDSLDPAFTELRKVLEIVLFQSSNDEIKKKFLQQLRHCLLSVNAISTIPEIEEAIKNIKLYVFTPFKYSGDTPMGPMALVFYDYKYRGNFGNKKIVDVISTSLQGKKTLLTGRALPVPRYSDVLSLIAGILAYATNEKKTSIIKVCIGKCSMFVKFQNEIFEISQLKETFQLMKTVAKEGLRKPQGNFRKPLLDFASVLSVDPFMIDSNIQYNKNTMSISYNEYKTKLSFGNNRLILQVQEVKKS